MRHPSAFSAVLALLALSVVYFVALLGLLMLSVVLERPLAAQSPATVKDYGHCDDVSSSTCPVRAYWPRADVTSMVGADAYWLLSTDGRVCFVDRRAYAEAIVGRDASCVWRQRRP